MKVKNRFYQLVLLLPILGGLLFAETLQQAYNNAPPGLGYDRLILLDPGIVYTGGLAIMDEKVGIKGLGTIIDLQGDSISAGGASVLDLDGCVIINGGKGLALRGNSSALVTHCTFYGNQIGIRCFAAGGMIEVKNTILANNTTYGIASCEEISRTLHYIDAYQNPQGNYMEWCPG
jgi:hypothetical protein